MIAKTNELLAVHGFPLSPPCPKFSHACRQSRRRTSTRFTVRNNSLTHPGPSPSPHNHPHNVLPLTHLPTTRGQKPNASRREPPPPFHFVVWPVKWQP